MNKADRLLTPIAAEIELPNPINLEDWENIRAALDETGVFFLNLVVTGDKEKAFKVAKDMASRFDVAITLPVGLIPSASELLKLTVLTVRLRVDTRMPPKSQLRSLLRELAPHRRVSAVVVGNLPQGAALNSWIDLFRNERLAAINIDDLDSGDSEEYEVFLKAVAGFARRIRVPVISDLPLMARARPEDPLARTLCPAGRLSLFVAADGTVRPCRRSSMAMGDLKSSTLTEIWRRREFQEWTADPPECLGCAIDSCRGGCRARARVGTRDPMCEGPLDRQGWRIRP